MGRLAQKLGFGPYSIIDTLVQYPISAYSWYKSNKEDENKPRNKSTYPEEWNELFINAHENNLDKVKELIASQPNLINVEDSNGFDLLQVAVAHNSVEVAKYLMSEQSSHFNINHQNKRGVNILHFIMINGFESLFEFIINNNKVSNIEALTSDNESVIFLAAANDHYEMLLKLIDYVKKQSPQQLISVINAENSHSVSALTLAVLRNNIDLVKLLIENGANVNTQKKDGSTPLHLACSLEDPSTDIIKLLLDNGANATTENTFGWSPLHVAYNNKDFAEKYQFIRTHLNDSNKVYLDSFDPEKKKVIPKQE